MRRWIALRWLAPHGWARQLQPDALVDVYLPCWSVRARTLTEYRGLRGEDRPDHGSLSGSDWPRRGRRSTRTRWRPAQGSVPLCFDGLLLCASRSLPERLVRRLIPQTLPPCEATMPGSTHASWTEHSAIDQSEGLRLVQTRMEREIRRAVRADIGGDRQRIHDVHTRYEDTGLDRLLWPVWVGSYRHRGELRRVLIDGTSGRVIGERPISFGRVITLIAVLMAALGWLLV